MIYVVIYYVVGLLIAFFGGLYVAWYYENILSEDEIKNAIEKQTAEVGLSDFRANLSPFMTIILDLISAAILPFISIIYTTRLIIDCDRRVREKNAG